MTQGPIFDWWIIPHAAFFIFLASAIHAAWEPKWWVHVLVWLLVSVSWEIAEHFLSRAYIKTWVVTEHPINAWVVDLLSNGVGYFIGWMIGRWSKSRF